MATCSFRIHSKIIIISTLQSNYYINRCIFKVFAFKDINDLVPMYLSELLHPYTPSQSLRLAFDPETMLKLSGDRTF